MFKPRVLRLRRRLKARMTLALAMIKSQKNPRRLLKRRLKSTLTTHRRFISNSLIASRKKKNV